MIMIDVWVPLRLECSLMRSCETKCHACLLRTAACRCPSKSTVDPAWWVRQLASDLQANRGCGIFFLISRAGSLLAPLLPSLSRIGTRLCEARSIPRVFEEWSTPPPRWRMLRRSVLIQKLTYTLPPSGSHTSAGCESTSLQTAFARQYRKRCQTSYCDRSLKQCSATARLRCLCQAGTSSMTLCFLEHQLRFRFNQRVSVLST